MSYTWMSRLFDAKDGPGTIVKFIIWMVFFNRKSKLQGLLSFLKHVGAARVGTSSPRLQMVLSLRKGLKGRGGSRASRVRV